MQLITIGCLQQAHDIKQRGIYKFRLVLKYMLDALLVSTCVMSEGARCETV